MNSAKPTDTGGAQNQEQREFSIRGVFGRRSATLALAWTLGIAGSLSGHANAQTDESKAVARALAGDGAKAFKAGRFEEAIDYLKRAEQVYHAPTHLLYVARAYERLGKLILAQENYLRILREDLPPRTAQAWRDAQHDAKAELIVLEKRIATLTIELDGGKGLIGVQVALDGILVPSALMGVGRPVDPGSHRVEANAEGWKSDALTFSLTDGEKRTVTLSLVPLPKPREDSGIFGAGSRAGEAPLDVPVESGGSPGLRVASYVAVGVAVAAAGAGTYFFLKQLGHRRRADGLEIELKNCKAPECNEERRIALDGQLKEEDKLADKIWIPSLGCFIGSGAALLTGVTLFVLSKPSSGPSSQQGVRVQPWVGLSTVGLRGEF